MNTLVVLGSALIVAGAGAVFYGSLSGGSSSSGGFILIGPFPIVFGSGSEGQGLALLSLALGILMLSLILVAALRKPSLTREGAEETDK